MSLTATQPIEVYTFTGSFKTYRYTSSETTVTVDALEYEPLPISRGAVQAGDQTQDQLDLEVTLPFDAEVVLDYAYLASPPNLELEIRGFDRSAAITPNAYTTATGAVLWSGEVTGFSVTDKLAKLKIPSNFVRALNKSVPAAYWQNPCNHVLFDGRCKVVRSAFSVLATVASASGTSVAVNDDGFADGFLNAGEIVNNRTGERRLILSNASNTLNINLAFVDILPGDEVELTAGCDHSFSTCRTKFNNTVNFGGHPFIPTDNPFEGTL